MSDEIVYVCNSTNNKNVRASELVILEKDEKQLCFKFGKDLISAKIRYYNDVETLNKDFEALVKIKKDIESEAKESKESKEDKEVEELNEEPNEEPKEVEKKSAVKSHLRK